MNKESSSLTTQRLDYLDCIKGIGILFIIIMHHLKDMPALTSYLSFAVLMFFMVSGYLMEARQHYCCLPKQFVIKKLKSLMYPYFTFSVLVILWLLFFYKLLLKKAIQPPLSKIVWQLLSTMGYRAFWFVPCLFWATLIFFFIRKTPFYHQIFICLTVILSIINFVSLFFYQKTFPLSHITPIFYFYRAIIASTFLYMGSVFCRLMNKWNIKRMCIVSLLIAFVLGCVCVLKKIDTFNFSTLNIGYLFFFYSTGIANSVFWITAVKLIDKFPEFLLFFGKNSLIIMFLHMDVSVEIAYLIAGRLHLINHDTLLSVIVIILEVVLLSCMIQLINRFFPYLIKFPKGKQKT